VNLVTALPAEAKPLINSYALKRRQPEGQLPLYQAPGIHLVISGPGTRSIANGVTYLHQITTSAKRPIWVNIGICGHGSLQVGELMVADSVIDQSGTIWQLESANELPVKLGPLTCVLQPQATYSPHMAYDMESSGFLNSLTSLTTLERVHIIKIVSDNPDTGIETINAKQVRSLIQEKISVISKLLTRVAEHV
jgi:nucleoside phosphorylase